MGKPEAFRPWNLLVVHYGQRDTGNPCCCMSSRMQSDIRLITMRMPDFVMIALVRRLGFGDRRPLFG